MNCQRAREIFPELLDARTPPTAQREARTHLAGCLECQREFHALAGMALALDQANTPPPARLRQNFHAMLEAEKQGGSPVRTIVPSRSSWKRRRWPRGWWSPLAGCALLALGFVAGQRASAPVRPAVITGDSMRHEITRLEEQLTAQQAKLEQMTTLMSVSILQQQRNPANERLQEVLARAHGDNPTEKDLDALIQALTLDPSANVRLRAIEALYPHAAREIVRAGVLAALPREQNPLVQLELIDFVGVARDHDAAPMLERISMDTSSNRAVRDAARLALAQF